MWHLPGPGLEPVSPALAGGFLTTVPPGKSQGPSYFLYFHFAILILLAFVLMLATLWSQGAAMGSHFKSIFKAGRKEKRERLPIMGMLFFKESKIFHRNTPSKFLLTSHALPKLKGWKEIINFYILFNRGRQGRRPMLGQPTYTICYIYCTHERWLCASLFGKRKRVMSFILEIDLVWAEEFMGKSEGIKPRRLEGCSPPEWAEVMVRALGLHRLWIWGVEQSQPL